LAPSTCNWTLATPFVSEAVTFTVIVPLTEALFAGEVIETVGGGAVCPLLTVIVSTVLVAETPVVSVATAATV
jgi:hypothetical protein